MKKKLLQTLMLLLAAWMLPACDPSGVEDNPDDGGDPEGTDNIVLELQLERDAAVVSFEETARIGFSLRVYGLEDSQKLHGIEDLQIEYSTMAIDDLYDLKIEPDDETSGTLTITGKTPDAGREDREVILLANSPLGYPAQAVVQLKRIECELLDAPEDNTYVAPVEGGTVEIDIRSNSKTLIPLVVEDEWVHYDPAQCSVSDGEYDLDFIHHHKLRIDPHTEGTDPRSSLISVYLQSGDLLLNLLVRQEVNFAADGREMILLVRAAPANARTVYLPLDDIVACTVDWGDGSREQFERRYTYDNPISHVYAEAGEYKVTIRGQVNAVTSFGMPSGALDNCILAVEQWGNLGAEEIVLRDITTLERIAPDTEGAFAKIRNFDRTFLGCTGLTELPEGLFARAESAAIFEATFYECTGLTKLPEGLFEGGRSHHVRHHVRKVHIPDGAARRAFPRMLARQHVPPHLRGVHGAYEPPRPALHTVPHGDDLPGHVLQLHGARRAARRAFRRQSRGGQLRRRDRLPQRCGPRGQGALHELYGTDGDPRRVVCLQFQGDGSLDGLPRVFGNPGDSRRAVRRAARTGESRIRFRRMQAD